MTCIALLNVKYSPNLGDGLLSECLERELARALPGCKARSIDLAGRSAYPVAPGRTRGAALALLERSPPRLRRFVAGAMLDALLTMRLRRHYRQSLAGADAVVLGGGNLLSDADLNFPKKIAGALEQARRLSLPVAVHGVGVSARWSTAGKRLFTQAFVEARLSSASVRDPLSRTAWQRHFADRAVAAPQLVIDPGVLASLHYAPAPASASGRRIGLCVTDPLAVRYHSEAAHGADLDAWYPASLRSLVEAGFEIVLFTNGSPEDRDYLNARFHDWIRKARGPVTLGRSFDTPRDLATFVSGCDAIVAHRMHACIAAYSFGVPAVGLRWDVKLDSFFELSGRAKHVLDPASIPAQTLGERTAAAIADPFDPVPLIARARREIATLAAHLAEIVAERPR